MQLDAQYDHLSHRLLCQAIYYPTMFNDVKHLYQNIHVLNNCIVVKQSPEQFYVYTHDHQVIPQISGHVRKTKYDNMIPFNSKQPTQNPHGHVCLIVVFCHYWHMLYETLLQVTILLDKFKDITDFKFLLTAPLTDQKYIQMFDLCCVRSNTCLQMDPHINYQINGTLYYMKIPVGFPQPWLLNYYTNQICHSNLILSKHNTLVYIPRKNTCRRLIINEDQLIQMLVRQFNFVVTYVKDMDFAQQVRMAYGARVFMSYNGTGFSANLTFTNHQSVIGIELVGKKVHTRTGMIIAKYFHIRHYCIQAIQKCHENDNVSVNVETIYNSLKNILDIEHVAY